MKKLLTILAASMIAASAIAHGSSHPAPASENQMMNVVSWKHAQRSLIFSSDYNTATPDGILLVCFSPNEGSSRDATCKNKSGQNQWVDVSTIQIPGFELVSFEYRYVGSGGYRTLILYFGKK